MAQYHKATPGPLSSTKHSHLHSRSPNLHAADKGKPPRLSAISEPDENLDRKVHMKSVSAARYEKSRLRVDAFLGEWLSPDYFENITAPPSSVMMVTTAKADLLRHAEAIEGSEFMAKPRQGHFPGGWGSDYSESTSATDDEDEVTGLANMASLGHSLPRKIRASSHSETGVTPVRHVAPRPPTKGGANQPAYTPPVPTYAISPSDPIPTGYVAHARDACVNSDLAWDSMRSPQDWGDGGEYGEEWSAMHKRFRNGLQKMVTWYQTSAEEETTAEEDEDMDTVLVLVTHGAGCNALIGALTNQPVLLDVGMASLTMAVRKDITEATEPRTPDLPPPLSPRLSRTTSSDPGLANEYDVKLVASTEHLRAGSNPLSSMSQLQSATKVTGSAPAGFGSHRQRFGSVSSSSSESFHPGETARGLSGLHRSSSAASAATRHYPTTLPIRAASGLWAGSSTPASDSGDDIVPNFGAGEVKTHTGDDAQIAEAVKLAAKSNGAVDGMSSSSHAVGVMRTASQRGLWGARGGGASVPHTKRRWTVDENRA